MDERKASESDDTLDAVWVIDSESGIRRLLDRKTGREITTEDKLNDKSL